MTNDLPTLLREIENGHFWGSLTLDYQNGALVLIRKTETTRPKPEGNTHHGSNR